jgi:diguanylate cyclase
MWSKPDMVVAQAGHYPTLVAALLTAVLLGAGLALGVLIGRRRRLKREPKQADHRLENLVTHLVDWTHDVADDVSQYRSVVRSVSNLFQGGCESFSDDQRTATAQLLAQVVEANEQLRQRLEHAEAKLTTQAGEISVYMSEARTDPLTGLANRRAYDEELTRRIAQRRRHGTAVSIVVVDIDHFKRFNDTFGHQAGDEVLRSVAGILQQTMRQSDVVARLGGEEMAVVIPGGDVEEAGMAAERARRAIDEARFHHDGHELHVTISLGVAQWMEHEDGAGLSKRADTALYAAKNAGRNRTYRHDGAMCRPVGQAADAVRCAPRPAGVDSSVPADSPRFSKVCDDLRRRLDEVAARVMGR